jgi:hypothetical protein
MLAYVGGAGNTLPEALQCLRQSSAADGTCPSGTVYYMVSDDWARTGPRQWAFRSAVAALERLSVRGEIAKGVLPKDKADVAGCMVGIASFSWKGCGSRLLPGAFCDHLTSFGGVMTGAGQTVLSEFTRYGAAGACGTVTEPYNIPSKFPTPFLHVYYASGCSLAEAFYQSIRSPYQQLLVGDPLCQPWARRPEVRVTGLSANEVLTKPRRLTPKATGALPAARFELHVDGRRQQSRPPGGNLLLDTKGLAAGYHEARVVAFAGPVETQGWAVLPFRLGKADITVRGWPADPVKPDSTLRLTASAPGARQIAFLQNGREMGVVEGASGTVEVPVSRLGAGPVELQLVASLSDGRELRGTPHRMIVGP